MFRQMVAHITAVAETGPTYFWYNSPPTLVFEYSGNPLSAGKNTVTKSLDQWATESGQITFVIGSRTLAAAQLAQLQSRLS